MTIKEFFSFRSNGLFWGNLIAMVVVVAGLLWGVLKALDNYTRHGEAVVVPDVKGMTVAEAVRVFAGKGLECVVSDSTYVKTLPAGCILDYHPGLGQKVKNGRVIYLTINTLNVPLRAVPDVADNSSAREAEARLTAAGFKLTPNDSVPGERDWVYGVRMGRDTLSRGAKVPAGAVLTLIIGNGRSVPQSMESLETDSVDGQPAESLDEESWF